MNNIVGLTTAEAKKQLSKYGLNQINKPSQISGLKTYLTRFKNPLVIILLLAAIASLGLNQLTSASIIITIVLISTTLDFINTYRSQKAAEALQRSVRVNARVWRDNKIKSVPLAHVVPSDIIELEAGSLVPADGQVASSNGLTIDESSLSGESFPVTKTTDQTVYMGSSVASGSGRIRITATGKSTEFAHLARSLSKDTPTEFDLEMARFSTLIARITLGLVLFILAINIIFKHNAMDALLFALALAVGLTPELLPLIITINLTKGSLRMDKKGAVVKKLSAIQNFGAMDVLCTDKTGTLTENNITVARVLDYSRSENHHVAELAAVVCKFSTAYENALDLAVLNYHKYNFSLYRKIQEIPFDFQRKRESVVTKTAGQTILISKGAADEMLPIVTAYRDRNGQARRMTVGAKAGLTNNYRELSRDGYRVLMIASRSVDLKQRYDKNDETNLVFEGYIAFIDPPKASAKKSLLTLRQNGVAVKIITGDDPLVAAKVAEQLGLDLGQPIIGADLAKLNKLQQMHQVEKTSIFARVNPSQKLSIIECLRHNGHVVGYMGDGINDAPSLKTADIGISVNNAVDIAKDSADIILKGKSLKYLNDGVIEGRKTFVNTMKYLKMALSSNFGGMFSMAASSTFLPFLPMTAPQILLGNMLYDISQLALPSDNVDANQLTKPQQMDMSAIKKFMWVFGLLSSMCDFVTFAIMLLVLHVNISGFRTGWFIESFLSQILIIFIVRTPGLASSSRPSKILTTSILAISVLAIAIVETSIGRYFGFIVLPFQQALIIGIITIVFLLIVELAKRIFYKRVTTAI